MTLEDLYEIDRLAADDEWRLGYRFGLADRPLPVWADDDFRDGYREGQDEREYRRECARDRRNRMARARRKKVRPYHPPRPGIAIAIIAQPALRKRAASQ